MAETYTNGIWLVKEGEEDDFVSAWRDFASWGHTWPGCGTLRLTRDHYEPNRFMSFGPWESFEAQQAWKDSPEFKADHARPAARRGLHAVGLRARDRSGLRQAAPSHSLD